jgi:hypothetical protein
MPKEIFVSYSSKDKTTALAVLDALERAGLSCWMAPRDVLPGLEYGEAIIEAINRARVMVLVFSASANASPQIRREVERAVHKGVPIIPVRVEDVFPSRSLEYFLSSPHWLDALGPVAPHLPVLTDAVKAMLVRVAEGTLWRAAPAPRRLFTRRAVPLPVQVQDTVPIEGLVAPPRLSRSVIRPTPLARGAPPGKPAGVPAGLIAVGAGLVLAAVAAVVAQRAANPAPERAASRPAAAPAASRPTARPAAPAAPEPKATASEAPALPQRTYECREGVRFVVWPETASVSVNGRHVGTAAQWSDRGGGRVYTFARPGAYQVRFSHKGFASTTLKIVVRGSAARDVAEVKLDLKRLD